MSVRFNVYSFAFCLVCTFLFAINYLTKFDFTSIHPLYITLSLTIVNLFLAIVGLFAVTEWKSGLRSLLTIIITLGLCAIQLNIIIFS